jgi:hypothetical protein
MEILFARRQAVADKLDAQAQRLLNDAKGLYAIAESHANATIKQQEDLNAQAAVMAQQEKAVVDQELKLWEGEEQDGRAWRRPAPGSWPVSSPPTLGMCT